MGQSGTGWTRAGVPWPHLDPLDVLGDRDLGVVERRRRVGAREREHVPR